MGWLRRWPSPLLLLTLWELGSYFAIIPEDKLASPLQILATAKRARRSTARSARRRSSRCSASPSGSRSARVIGLALAVLAGLSRIGEDAVDPPMQMLRTLPHFGLIPLLIVWLGIGEMPKIALIALGVVFPLYLNTFAGIRSIDRKFLEAAKTLRLEPPPAAAPRRHPRRRCRRRSSGCGRASASPGSR